MSGKFDCTGFVCADMSRVSRYNALIRCQHGVNDNLVGLCSTGQQKDFYVLTATCFLNLLFGSITVMIHSITGKLLHIGVNQVLKNFFVGTL